MTQTIEERDERRRQRQRDWYERNRESVIQGVRAWQQANPEKVKMYRKRRREKLANERGLGIRREGCTRPPSRLFTTIEKLLCGGERPDGIG